jgi:hypothetical protein
MRIGRFCPPKLRSKNLVPMGGGTRFISNFCLSLSADICPHDSIHGVTFLSFDGSPTTDTHTLLSLQRLYSSLNLSSPQWVSPPHRLLFPSIPTFVGHTPLPEEEPVVRPRSLIGISPQMLKAAYPSLVGVQFAEDFDDFAKIGVPFIFDRLVIADRTASQRAGLISGVPPWARPFTALRAGEDWFESVRRTLAEYFGAEDSVGASGAGAHTITYLSRQGSVEGERLRTADHAALLDALQKLARTNGVKIHVIDENASWSERMHAIIQSTVS